MLNKIKISNGHGVREGLGITMRHPLCSSLEGIFYGAFTFFGGKSTAVGMLTNIIISNDYGVLAEYGGAHQAEVKNNTITLGNLAFRSVWQIKKVFHREIFNFCLHNVKLQICYLFASLEGIFYGGFTFFGGKSTEVGMLTQISISKLHGMLAEHGVARRAHEKTSSSKIRNIAFCSV